VSHTKL